MQKVSQATEGKRGVRNISEGSLPVLWKVTEKERRSAFRLARHCYCKFTIKVLLIFMVCLNYLERLTFWD